MSDNKDPAIKLFGKTIQLLSDDDTNIHVSHPQQTSSTQISSSHDNQNHSGGELTETNQQDVSSHPPNASGMNEDPKTPCTEKEIPSSTTNKKDDPSEASNSEEKTLKKPDKLLPCPRCNSMDTKFCYYNNYNVNQPRYFCKNCQRYWTAGGTMRNVPVGSGRRKNKASPSSHYHHIIVSEALHTARADAANGVHLSFGSDPHLCESMASALTLAEKSQRNAVSCGGGENREDFSSGSSSTASNPAEKGNKGGLREPISNNFSLPNPPPCFPGTPWPIPWNPAQWGYPMPSSPPPAYGPPGFPVSFYPVPQYWNVPWMPPQFTSLDNPSLRSSPNSPILGKHSRDGHMLTPSNSGIEVTEDRELERGVLIPKTLRISDPSEAAKSSIWSTLGIKNDNSDSVGREGVLMAFQPKDNEKNHTAETSPMLQANPAALSRSLNFHEST